MIFPDSCPSNQVELKRRECDFVGLLRCVCHQGLRDGVHSISEAEAGTRYEPQLGSVNATPFHTTLIGVIPRGRMDWIIVIQGSSLCPTTGVGALLSIIELHLFTCCAVLLLPVPQRPSLLPPWHDELALEHPHYIPGPASGRGNVAPCLVVWRIWLPSSLARCSDWRIWVGVPGGQLWIWWLAVLPPSAASPSAASSAL